MNNLSSSGARIGGDDYQHLIGWIYAVNSCLPNSNVTHIGVEDLNAGNADDVTIYKDNNSKEFIQIKFSVDGRALVNIDWLMQPSKTGGASIIQGLFATWEKHSTNDCKTQIKFICNRPASNVDGFISVRDGKNGTVINRVSSSIKNNLASHLQTSPENISDFLGDLSFVVGRLYDEFRNEAKTCMYCTGLRYDEEAITTGESIVRKWVTNGKRKLAVSEIKEEIKKLIRPDGLPRTSLLIQAIDRDPAPETATVVLDWVDLFEGDEPRVRRVLKDNKLWNGKLRKEIQQAAKLLKSNNDSRVLIRGFMRLPTWFTTGVEFSKTVGFKEVVSFQGGEPWSSIGDMDDFLIEIVRDEKLSGKDDIAIGISVSADLSNDVLQYLKTTPGNIERFMCIAPRSGIGNTIFQNDKQVRKWAYNTRDIIRGIVCDYQPSKIHLFISAPSGATLLLGHLWDRMPPTQLYEDGGAVGNYCPSFFIPN